MIQINPLMYKNCQSFYRSYVKVLEKENVDPQYFANNIINSTFNNLIDKIRID